MDLKNVGSINMNEEQEEKNITEEINQTEIIEEKEKIDVNQAEIELDNKSLVDCYNNLFLYSFPFQKNMDNSKKDVLADYKFYYVPKIKKSDDSKAEKVKVCLNCARKCLKLADAFLKEDAPMLPFEECECGKCNHKLDIFRQTSKLSQSSESTNKKKCYFNKAICKLLDKGGKCKFLKSALKRKNEKSKRDFDICIACENFHGKNASISEKKDGCQCDVNHEENDVASKMIERLFEYIKSGFDTIEQCRIFENEDFRKMTLLSFHLNLRYIKDKGQSQSYKCNETGLSDQLPFFDAFYKRISKARIDISELETTNFCDIKRLVLFVSAKDITPPLFEMQKFILKLIRRVYYKPKISRFFKYSENISPLHRVIIFKSQKKNDSELSKALEDIFKSLQETISTKSNNLLNASQVKSLILEYIKLLSISVQYHVNNYSSLKDYFTFIIDAISKNEHEKSERKKFDKKLAKIAEMIINFQNDRVFDNEVIQKTSLKYDVHSHNSEGQATANNFNSSKVPTEAQVRNHFSFSNTEQNRQLLHLIYNKSSIHKRDYTKKILDRLINPEDEYLSTLVELKKYDNLPRILLSEIKNKKNENQTEKIDLFDNVVNSIKGISESLINMCGKKLGIEKVEYSKIKNSLVSIISSAEEILKKEDQIFEYQIKLFSSGCIETILNLIATFNIVIEDRKAIGDTSERENASNLRSLLFQLLLISLKDNAFLSSMMFNTNVYKECLRSFDNEEITLYHSLIETLKNSNYKISTSSMFQVLYGFIYDKETAERVIKGVEKKKIKEKYERNTELLKMLKSLLAVTNERDYAEINQNIAKTLLYLNNSYGIFEILNIIYYNPSSLEKKFFVNSNNKRDDILEILEKYIEAFLACLNKLDSSIFNFIKDDFNWSPEKTIASEIKKILQGVKNISELYEKDVVDQENEKEKIALKQKLEKELKIFSYTGLVKHMVLFFAKYTLSSLYTYDLKDLIQTRKRFTFVSDIETILDVFKYFKFFLKEESFKKDYSFFKNAIAIPSLLILWRICYFCLFSGKEQYYIYKCVLLFFLSIEKLSKTKYQKGLSDKKIIEKYFNFSGKKKGKEKRGQYESTFLREFDNCIEDTLKMLEKQDNSQELDYKVFLSRFLLCLKYFKFTRKDFNLKINLNADEVLKAKKEEKDGKEKEDGKEEEDEENEENEEDEEDEDDEEDEEKEMDEESIKKAKVNMSITLKNFIKFIQKYRDAKNPNKDDDNDEDENENKEEEEDGDRDDSEGEKNEFQNDLTLSEKDADNREDSELLIDSIFDESKLDQEFSEKIIEDLIYNIRCKIEISAVNENPITFIDYSIFPLLRATTRLFKLNPQHWQEKLVSLCKCTGQIMNSTISFQNFILAQMYLYEVNDILSSVPKINFNLKFLQQYLEFLRLLCEDHNPLFQTMLVGSKNYFSSTKGIIELTFNISNEILKIITYKIQQSEFLKYFPIRQKFDTLVDLESSLNDFRIEVVQGTTPRNLDAISEESSFCQYLENYMNFLDNLEKGDSNVIQLNAYFIQFVNCFFEENFVYSNFKPLTTVLDRLVPRKLLLTALKAYEKNIQKIDKENSKYNIYNKICENPSFIISFYIYVYLNRIADSDLKGSIAYQQLLNEGVSSKDTKEKYLEFCESLMLKNDIMYNIDISKLEDEVTIKNYWRILDKGTKSRVSKNKAKAEENKEEKEIEKMKESEYGQDIMIRNGINKQNLTKKKLEKFLRKKLTVYYLKQRDSLLITQEDSNYFLKQAKYRDEYSKLNGLLKYYNVLSNKIEMRKSFHNDSFKKKLSEIELDKQEVINAVLCTIPNLLFFFTWKYPFIYKIGLYMEGGIIIFLMLVIVNFFYFHSYKIRNILKKNLPVKNESEEKEKDKETEIENQEEEEEKHQLSYFYPFFNFHSEIFPFVWAFVFGILGFIHPFFFSFQLFTMFNIFETMTSVLYAIRERYQQFGSTAFLLIILLLIYGSLTNDKFNYIEETQTTICSNYLECFLYLFNNGIRAGGVPFEPKVDEQRGFWSEFFYSWIFYFLIILIILNIINGIIVDTFQYLREENAEIYDQQTNYCYICQISRGQFESNGIKFEEEHKVKDHNVFNYFCYLFKINRTDPHDLNSVDFQVYNSIKESKVDFFPIRCARGIPMKDDEN